MGEDQIYIVPDLLEEIFLGLPLKSILKFKTVSKQWRSILESDSFVERRMNVKKSRKILAATNCKCGDRPSLQPESLFEGDEEFVFLHCDAYRPSMTCNGLVCFPEPDWITVLNPSTGQLLRFPSGPDPVSSRLANGAGLHHFLGRRVFGFGRDKVTRSYKVVKMFVDRMEEECYVLYVESGEWKKLRVPPYVTDVGRKPVCVNGSMYWLFMVLNNHIGSCYHILALDLHKEEFHRVSVPDSLVKVNTQMVNLEDRLAIANETVGPDGTLILEIFIMNADEEIWSKTYSIRIPGSSWSSTFTPVAVSKQGDVVLYQNFGRLLKYYIETEEIRCFSSDIRVMYPYLENLAPLRSESGHHDPDYNKLRTSRCRFFLKHPKLGSSGISKFLKRVITGITEIAFSVGYILMASLCKWWKEELRTGSTLSVLGLMFSYDKEAEILRLGYAGDGECTCGGKIMKVISDKPTKGDAVLFWSMGLKGQSDPRSIPGVCEVLSGEKWSATKW